MSCFATTSRDDWAILRPVKAITRLTIYGMATRKYVYMRRAITKNLADRKTGLSLEGFQDGHIVCDSRIRSSQLGGIFTQDGDCIAWKEGLSRYRIISALEAAAVLKFNDASAYHHSNPKINCYRSTWLSRLCGGTTPESVPHRGAVQRLLGRVFIIILYPVSNLSQWWQDGVAFRPWQLLAPGSST